MIIEKIPNILAYVSDELKDDEDIVSLAIKKNESLLNLAKESYICYNEKCQDSNCDKVALSRKKPYAVYSVNPST